MKRDREPIAQGVAVHYQPQRHLLKDRIILVTGASDGIGREAALTYARYSASVILLGRNNNKLRTVAQEIEREGGIPPRWFTLDLLTCTPQACQQLAQQISMHYPRLDGVLHNAGLLGDICPMEEQKPEVWQQVMQVNVNGTFMLTQALLPLLLRSESGSLVFTSSSVGRQGRANWGAYAVFQIRHRRDDAGAGRRVSKPPPAGKLYQPRRHSHRNAPQGFPTEDPLKLKTPADIMPVYLWLMGDDSRRKTGMTFDAQPGRKPGIAQ